MTRETKVGLSIAATVFAVVGGALAYKLYFLTPGTGGLAQSTSASVAEPQVVPARSESSSAATHSSPSQQASSFQPEIRSATESPPTVHAAAEAKPPTPPDNLPPAPPVLITEKPPVSLADAEKTCASAIDPAKPRDSGSPQMSTPPSTEPPSSPFSSAPARPPEPSPPVEPPVPVPPPPSPVTQADAVPPTQKPNATEEKTGPQEKSLPPAPPVVVIPNDVPFGKPSAPSAAVPLPGSPVVPSVEKAPLDKPTLPVVSPSAEPAAVNDMAKPAPSATNPPSLNVPSPPPSDAFDRSYPAPPASLVASRNNQPKPEDAIPVTIRPQTQPLTPPPPDGYPVKIVPSPSGKPVEVLDYEVQRYTAGPGETWEGISRNKYGSERFARALAAFNRDRNPGLTVPSPGATILLPPAYILQRRYPQLIEAASPTPNYAANATSGTNTASGSANSGTTVYPPSAPAPAPSGAYKLYRVQPNDTIWMIAKRTLGSGDRWPEILRLNRDVLRDVNQLPPGLVLRLPPDARVDENTVPR